MPNGGAILAGFGLPTSSRCSKLAVRSQRNKKGEEGMGDFARDLMREHLQSSLLPGTVAGLLPVPGTSTLALTALEAVLVAKATEVYNDRLDPQGIVEEAKSLLPVAGKAIALKTLAEACTFVPVVGWIAKPFVTRAALQTMGEGAIGFFEKRNPDRVY